MAITKKIERGSVLYHTGEESSSVFIVKSGVVSLKTRSGLLDVSSGEVLGLFDVLLQRDYSADAVAASPVTAVILTRQEVQSLQAGSLIYKIIQTSVKRLDTDMPGRWS